MAFAKLNICSKNILKRDFIYKYLRIYYFEKLISRASIIILSEDQDLVISKSLGLVMLKSSSLINRSNNTFLNITIS